MDSNKRIAKFSENVKRPVTSTLTTEERIKVIANLIVDKLLDVQNNKHIGINKSI